MAKRLELRFGDAAAFRQEYERNMREGGAVVPTAAELDLREIVDVELVLEWRDERLGLEAEVVHCGGGLAAVQFLTDVRELRERLEALLEASRGTGALGPAPDPPGGRAVGPPAASARDPETFDLEGIELQDLASALESSLGAGEPIDAEAVGAIEPVPAMPFDPSERDLAPADPTTDDDPFASATTDDDPFATATTDVDPLADGTADGDPLTVVQDRRRARRGPARLPARVDAPHLQLEGRTRDLSETGVLISADGSDLPLGKAVCLQLTHPRTGERVEVAGRVSRHVEADGTVAAVGIEFDRDGSGAEEIADFVRAAKQVEAERIVSGISGTIEELGMANLIQMLGQSSERGTLTAMRGSEEAVVAFERGRLRYVRLGGLRAGKALARLLSWEDGSFTFHSQVDPLDEEDEPRPLDAAILDAVRLLDEANRASAPPLGPATTFRLDRDALAAGEGLTKTEEAVVDLAGAGFTLRRILDVIPESDAEIREALRSLEERGVLEPGR